MQREITNEFIKWKNSHTRKPLLITGVRQCGKTYAMKEFGEQHFEDVAYFNFEKYELLNQVFETDYNIERILDQLSIINGKAIVPGKTLVIFDEIQACPRAISSLKYFCEDKQELHVMCAGSLLGVAIKRQNLSFPVGKVDRIQMYPMTFHEFLKAQDIRIYQLTVTEITVGKEISKAYRDYLEQSLKLYYIIGGMPEVVSKWLETKDIEKVETLQDSIMSDYKGDFAKHAPVTDIPKLGWIWDSVPEQLAKENNKFMYSHAKPGKRAADLEDALEWLIDSGLVYKLNLVEHIGIPLSAYSNSTYFKLYMSDIGLLRRKAGISAESILLGDKLYQEFKGALTENYVMNELIAQKYNPYFWRNDNTAEVDFIIEEQGNIIPIEVKSEDHTRAKSYSVFCKKYKPEIGFKFSLKNIGEHLTDNTTTYSVPLYLIWKIDDYLSKNKTKDLIKQLNEQLSCASKNILKQ